MMLLENEKEKYSKHLKRLDRLNISDERVFEQLSYCVPVSRILFQTNRNELLGIHADRGCFRKFYLVFHYFNEVSFVCNVKRHSSEK